MVHRVSIHPVLLSSLLALIALCCLTPSSFASDKIAKVLDIGLVWPANPARFSLVTAGNYQYVAFYNADRYLTVAARTLDSDRWQYIVLPQQVLWDAHNYIDMAVDRQGCVHLSGNMHCVPLVYFRTDIPYDISTFRQLPMLGNPQSLTVKANETPIQLIRSSDLMDSIICVGVSEYAYPLQQR